MFLPNKYTRWYFNIIDKAKSRREQLDYKERHHITPRSLGGDNNPKNLVDLTAREHFICHLLLTKMLQGKERSKMVYAVHRILHGNKKIYCKSSRIYEMLKKEHSKVVSEQMKGKNNYFYGKSLIGKKNGFYGRKHTKETKRKMSESRKGKGAQPGKLNPRYGKKGTFLGLSHTEETKRKISETKKNNPIKGKMHPRSIPVIINGVMYESKNIAREETGLTEYMINKYASGEI